MILSHDYRFIFVKPKKVAGTSLEILLSQLCGPDDIITPIARKDEATRSRLGFPGPQNYRKRLRETNFDDWRANFMGLSERPDPDKNLDTESSMIEAKKTGSRTA